MLYRTKNNTSKQPTGLFRHSVTLHTWEFLRVAGIDTRRAKSRREAPALAGSLVEGFSVRAVWLVPGLFLAGVLLAVLLTVRA